MNLSLNISDAISKGWSASKKNWIVLIGIFLSYIILSLLIEVMFSFKPGIYYIIAITIAMIFNTGLFKMLLESFKGNEPDFSVFKTMLNRVIPFTISNILCALIFGIGLILLIIPGIYLASRLSMVLFLIIDKPQISITEAFKESWNMTKGNVGNILLLFLIYIGIIILGLIAFFVGVFFSYVVVYYISAAVYFQLKNNYENNLENNNNIINE